MAANKPRTEAPAKEKQAEPVLWERIKAWMTAEITTLRLMPGMKVGRTEEGLELSIPFRVMQRDEAQAMAGLLKERLGKDPDLKGIVFATSKAEDVPAGIGGYAKAVFTEKGARFIIALPENATKLLKGDEKAMSELGLEFHSNYARMYNEKVALQRPSMRAGFMADLKSERVETNIRELNLDLPCSKELLDAMGEALKTNDYRLLGLLRVMDIVEHEYYHALDYRGFEEKEHSFRKKAGELLHGAALHPTVMIERLIESMDRSMAKFDAYINYFIHPQLYSEIPSSPSLKMPPKQTPLAIALCGVYLADELARRGIGLHERERACAEIVAIQAEKMGVALKRDRTGLLDRGAIARAHGMSRNAFFANPSPETAEEYAKMEIIASQLHTGPYISWSPIPMPFSESVYDLLKSAENAQVVGTAPGLSKKGGEYMLLLCRHLVEGAQFQAVTESKAYAFTDHGRVPSGYSNMAIEVSIRLETAAKLTGFDSVKEKVWEITDLAEFHRALRELGVKET